MGARLEDEYAPTGDSTGLPEQVDGIVGISQHKREQAHLEYAIGKRQSHAVEQDRSASDDVEVHHVGLHARARCFASQSFCVMAGP
jgi:hypothetical protein